MFKITKKAKHCKTCKSQTEPEKGDYFCDFCDKQLASNEIHEIDNLYHKYDTPQLLFCGIDCQIKWLKSGGYDIFYQKYSDTTQDPDGMCISPFRFIRKKDVHELIKRLK